MNEKDFTTRRGYVYFETYFRILRLTKELGRKNLFILSFSVINFDYDIWLIMQTTVKNTKITGIKKSYITGNSISTKVRSGSMKRLQAKS